LSLESRDESCRQLDAIALGIVAKLDPKMDYLKTVIRKTKEVGQQIGFNNSTIQRWEENKHKQFDKGIEAINESMIKKHRRR